MCLCAYVVSSNKPFSSFYFRLNPDFVIDFSISKFGFIYFVQIVHAAFVAKSFYQVIEFGIRPPMLAKDCD